MDLVNIKIWVVTFTEPITADDGERICFSKKTAEEEVIALNKKGIGADINEEIVTSVEVV